MLTEKIFEIILGLENQDGTVPDPQAGIALVLALAMARGDPAEIETFNDFVRRGDIEGLARSISSMATGLMSMSGRAMAVLFEEYRHDPIGPEVDLTVEMAITAMHSAFGWSRPESETLH